MPGCHTHTETIGQRTLPLLGGPASYSLLEVMDVHSHHPTSLPPSNRSGVPDAFDLGETNTSRWAFEANTPCSSQLRIGDRGRCDLRAVVEPRRMGLNVHVIPCSVFVLFEFLLTSTKHPTPTLFGKLKCLANIEILNDWFTYIFIIH